jgi:hypothetical protein
MAKAKRQIQSLTVTAAVMLVASFLTAPSQLRAHPGPARLEAPAAFLTVKRCPPRFRRSTVTGLCVRVPWRLPWLGWIISR